MSAPTYNKTRPAARYVERVARGPADAQWLKEALGLVLDDGSLAPDDTRVYTLTDNSVGNAPRDKNAAPPRDRSAVPAGLLNPPPESAQESPKKRRGPKPPPKVIRPRKPREIPECGTYKAFSRHKRRIAAGHTDEILDDACLAAGREYSRVYQAERTARLKRAAEFKRLTEAGVNEQTAQVLSELAR